MSSSSSDSDSDESEPIRRIKINIRPKEEVVRRGAADVSEIKASVEAWRPLGPPPHSSLTRRQSSLSSVSSVSFGTNSIYGGSNVNSSPSTNSNAAGSLAGAPFSGAPSSGTTTIHSSPSCSSLVNEFNNRSSFSNFMSNISRTSSPSTIVNFGDAVPIAIAIQESIELIIRGHYNPSAIEPKFNTRFMGNIKVAFPNAFAKGIHGKQISPLRLRLHSSESIIRYYASRLIKDLDLGTANGTKAEQSIDSFSQRNESNTNSNKQQSINGSYAKVLHNLASFDPLDSVTSSSISSSSTATAQQSPMNAQADSQKTIEFDMGALMNQLKKMYDQSPASRYYNVDVLRYQIEPITSIEESPLQVCAYWKVEDDMVKIRIDYKHSSKSGLTIERLREIMFTVNLADFIPPGINVNSLSPDSLSGLKLNNNNSAAMNMNKFESACGNNAIQPTVVTRHPVSLIDDDSIYNQPSGSVVRGILSPLASINDGLSSRPSSKFDAFGAPLESTQRFAMNSNSSNDNHQLNSEPLTPTNFRDMYSQSNQLKQTCSNPMPPYITYEPQAHWNNSIKQLTWKFDNLQSHYKTDELGSLFVKLDFRNYQGMPSQFLKKSKPTPVDVKFLVIDSTLSKISLSIDSTGYKMSLLKKEIRSGRYRSEPYVL